MDGKVSEIKSPSKEHLKALIDIVDLTKNAVDCMKKFNGVINADLMCTGMLLKVYILGRKDKYNYDKYIEQIIVAETEEKAIELAEKEHGEWEITKVVDLSKEQVLTKKF